MGEPMSYNVWKKKRRPYRPVMSASRARRSKCLVCGGQLVRLKKKASLELRALDLDYDLICCTCLGSWKPHIIPSQEGQIIRWRFYSVHE